MREFLQRLLLRILARIREPWYSWCKCISNLILLLRNPEVEEHPGGPKGILPERTIYLIDDFPYNVGLATWYDNVLGRMERAERRGWIPVVAKATLSDATRDIVERGDWYDYFTPVSEVSPSDISRCANVVRAKPLQMVHKRFNRSEISIRHRLSKKAAFSDDTMNFILPRFEELFRGGAEECVGIYYRGTDYRRQGGYCPTGHAVALEYDAFMRRIERVLQGWNIPIGKGEKMFFVTEEQDALNAFIAQYPAARFFTKPRFARADVKTKTPMHVPVGTTFRENNLMYLLDLYALSRCGYLVGPINGGLLMALNLNGNRYKGVHVLNTGVN